MCTLAKSGDVGGHIRPAIANSLLPVRILQPLALCLSAPTINSPPSSCHGEKFIHRSQLELGFRKLGLTNFGPPTTFWINLRIGGPSPFNARPMFFSLNLMFSLVVLMRFIALMGRGHPSRHMSTSLQDLVDSFQADLKQMQFMAHSSRQCSQLFEENTRVFDLESPRRRDGLELGPISSTFLLSIRCKLVEIYCVMLGRSYYGYPTLPPTIFDVCTGHDIGFIFLSMSNPSFKKTLKFSSQW